MLKSPNYADSNTIAVINITPAKSELIDTMPKQTDFPKWLEKQMNERGWGQADLANRAGINRQVVWGYLNRSKKPSEEILIKIADALEIPPTEILRAAGVLPMETGNDAITETIVHLIGDLDTTSKLRILEQIKLERRLSGKGKDDS